MTKTIMLLLTYDCNLRCSYCYEPKLASKVMSASDAKSYISKIVSGLSEEYDRFEVHFMGGEPMMEFNTIVEISEWLWTIDWKRHLEGIFVVTNGTLLSKEMKTWLRNNHHRICLGLSFDGTRLMQNKNRSKSYDLVDIQFFATTWPEQPVKMTISPYTLRYLTDGIKFLHSEGFGHILVDLAMGVKLGWSSTHLSLLQQQLISLSEFYRSNPGLLECSLLQLDIFNVTHRYGHDKNCGCGESLVCVDTDGIEYACHLFSPIVCGEDKSKDSLDIDFSNHELFCDKVCGECSLRLICPRCHGMSYSQFGDLTRQDSFVCQSFRIIYLQNCRHELLKALEDKDQIKIDAISNIIRDFKTQKAILDE